MIRPGQFHDKAMRPDHAKSPAAHGARVAKCKRCARCHEGKCRPDERQPDVIDIDAEAPAKDSPTC